MKGFTALLRKELAALFYSPIAYAVMAVYAIIMSYTFSAWLFVSQTASLVRVIYQAAVLLMIVMPVLTMRTLAEERRAGTLYLLLATSTPEIALVAAKFCACLALVMVMLLLTLAYPLTLQWFGAPDWGAVYSGILGLWLLAAMLGAMGLWISALTTNQIVAGIVSLGLAIMLWMLDSLGQLLPSPFDVIIVNASTLAHFTPMSIGALYLSDLGYFITLTLLFLFLTQRALARP